MNYLKRAIINNSRNKKKSLILFLLVFLLGILVSGAISLRSALFATDMNLRRNMRPVIVIETDLVSLSQALHEGFDGSPELTAESIYAIAGLDSVAQFDYSLLLQLNSRELALVEPTTGWNPELGIVSRIEQELGEFYDIWGVSNSNFRDLHLGLINIVQGETFTLNHLQEGKAVAVVSRLWATYHGFSVGDSFSLDHPVQDFELPDLPVLTDNPIEFEIIGLFEVNYRTLGDENINDFNEILQTRIASLENGIFIPNSFIREIREKHDQLYYKLTGIKSPMHWGFWGTSPFYVLYDPLDVQNFRIQAEPLLDDFFMITDASNRFAPISGSMEMMREISDIILWSSIGASLLILSLLITLFLRDRRHEIGLYMALGEKKVKILFQIMIEIILVTFIALTLSIFIGSLLANVLSTTIMQQQMEEIAIAPRRALDLEIDGLERLGLGTPMSGEEMLEFYDFSLNSATILTFYFVSFATVVAATITPIIYILRLRPKEALL